MALAAEAADSDVKEMIGPAKTPVLKVQAYQNKLWWMRGGLPHVKNAQGRLPVLGELALQVCHKGVTVECALTVLECAGPSLCGRDLNQRLNSAGAPVVSFVENSAATNDSSESSVNSIFIDYNDVFFEELGLIKGPPASLHMKEGAVPKFCKARPIPYALRERVSLGLDRLVSVGMLSPVAHSEWATPIVEVLKKDGAAERNYSQLEREALALVFGLTKFRDYLLGRAFTLVTDHQPLLGMLKSDKQTPTMAATRIQRWALQLGAYRYRLQYAPGRQMLNADALSRLPQRSLESDDDGEPPEYVLSLKQLNNGTIPTPALSFEPKSPIEPPVQTVSDVLDCAGPSLCGRDLIQRLNSAGAPVVSFVENSAATNDSSESSVNSIFIDNNDVFFEELGLIKDPPASLHMKEGAVPKFCKARPIPYALRERVSLGLDRLVSVGMLSPVAHSEWATPIVVVLKKDGAAERNYSQLEREALALVFGVTKFHDYLLGQAFTLVTDHQPLLGLLKSDKQTPTMAATRIQRWALQLGAYRYRLQYAPGRQMLNADAFGRLPQRSPESDDDGEPPEYVLSLNQLNNGTITTRRAQDVPSPRVRIANTYADYGVGGCCAGDAVRAAATDGDAGCVRSCDAHGGDERNYEHA
ncbi:uncharacterized protein [Dermacentor andersoni]|uniref:uncharacterized protein n=1 Tax=Dermacentor andersoni TaxID=34620 RepID=UPI003B3A0E89